jgi:hypothetical protein
MMCRLHQEVILAPHSAKALAGIDNYIMRVTIANRLPAVLNHDFSAGSTMLQVWRVLPAHSTWKAGLPNPGWHDVDANCHLAAFWEHYLTPVSGNGYGVQRVSGQHSLAAEPVI